MWSKPSPLKIQDYLLRSSLKVKLLQNSTKKLFKEAVRKFLLKKANFVQVVPELFYWIYPMWRKISPLAMWISTWIEESAEATPLPRKLLINYFYFKLFYLNLFLFMLHFVEDWFFPLSYSTKPLFCMTHQGCSVAVPSAADLLPYSSWFSTTENPSDTKTHWCGSFCVEPWSICELGLTPTSDRSTTTPKGWQKAALDRVNTAQFLSILGMLCVFVGEARESCMLKAFKRLQCLLDQTQPKGYK